jgi:hypothetical protein
LWFRFYALYDKVYREDVLAFAYQCCKANGGVVGQSFEDIEKYAVEWWWDEVAREQGPNLSTVSGPARLFAQAGGTAATVSDPHHSGPGGGNGGSPGIRTDFRGGSAAGTVCLSA